MAVYRLLSVYIAIACCNACLKVEFLVDKVMVDKTSNSDLQAMLSGISTNNECGIKCMETTGCMSFFYNQADGNCRLHSAMFKSSESSLAATPGFTYRKPFCPPFAKDLIPNGKTGVFSEGGFLVARTSCESDAIFVGTADSVKCDADGFWPEMGSCALTRWSNPNTTSLPLDRYTSFSSTQGRPGGSTPRVTTHQICTSHVIETAGHLPRVRMLSDKQESTAMAGNYIKKSTVPFNESIPFTTKSGTVIEFIGRSFEKEFQMEIGAGSDIALYMKATEDGSLNRGFKTSAKNENVIISTSAFYKPPKDFKCSLKISSTEFSLSVGDGEVFTYTSGVEVELIDQLRFMGGIELKELRMNQ